MRKAFEKFTPPALIATVFVLFIMGHSAAAFFLLVIGGFYMARNLERKYWNADDEKGGTANDKADAATNSSAQ